MIGAARVASAHRAFSNERSTPCADAIAAGVQHRTFHRTQARSLAEGLVRPRVFAHRRARDFPWEPAPRRTLCAVAPAHAPAVIPDAEARCQQATRGQGGQHSRSGAPGARLTSGHRQSVPGRGRAQTAGVARRRAAVMQTVFSSRVRAVQLCLSRLTGRSAARSVLSPRSCL